MLDRLGFIAKEIDIHQENTRNSRANPKPIAAIHSYTVDLLCSKHEIAQAGAIRTSNQNTGATIRTEEIHRCGNHQEALVRTNPNSTISILRYAPYLTGSNRITAVVHPSRAKHNLIIGRIHRCSAIINQPYTSR